MYYINVYFLFLGMHLYYVCSKTDTPVRGECLTFIRFWGFKFVFVMFDCIQYLEVGNERGRDSPFWTQQNILPPVTDVLAVNAHQHTRLNQMKSVRVCIVISRGNQILWWNEWQEEWNAERTGLIIMNGWTVAQT